MNITVESPIERSPRVAQVEGMFDLPVSRASRQQWHVSLPLDRKPWSIGLIVGPSGCGKTTIARHYFEEVWHRQSTDLFWPKDRSILDGFPLDMPIQDIVELLSSVGFASPPAWLRPFHVLSTGQQFRAMIARLLAMAKGDPVIMDEFTSTVDRTVAKIGSAAIARAVRRRKQQFVALTCHEDVERWLQPDWIYRPAEQTFAWRCQRPRPEIALSVLRCKASAWPQFAPHHYLSTRLMRGAICFLATWEEAPVAFSSWVPFYGKGQKARREHRTVTLPDYQGVGIGNALSNCIAALWRGQGYRALSTTTHPGMIRSRLRSSQWQCTRPPSLVGWCPDAVRHASTRLTTGFEHVGEPLSALVGHILLNR